MDQWDTWQQFINWTPLRNFPRMGTPLGDDLYKIEANVYLSTVPFTRDLVRSRRGPFITMLLWAASDGAVLRAARMNIEADDLLSATPPPEMLLPETKNPNYSELLTAAKSGLHGKHMEHASYRIASDGRFIHKTISVGRFEFHFRNRNIRKREMPYCIAFRAAPSGG